MQTSSDKKAIISIQILLSINILLLLSGCAQIKELLKPILPRPVSKLAPKVKHLRVKSATENSATIEWQSPGKTPVPDKEKCFYDNKAQAYVIKYSTVKITEENWDKSFLKLPPKIPTPKWARAKEQISLKNLVPNTEYYIGIKYFIQNKCTKSIESSTLAVISFKTGAKEIVGELPASPISLGYLKEDGYQVVPVLVYHDVAEAPRKSTEVSLDDFYQQMKYLYDNGYKSLTTTELYDFMNLKSKIPGKSVLITFDDGYKSMYDLVAKILREFNFHGILFIYTDAVVGKYGKTMTWEQIKKLSKGVFEVQSHTKEHSTDIAWPRENESETDYNKRLDNEMGFSRNLLKEKIGKETPYLAYAYGKYSDDLIDVLNEKYKYKGAFTVIGAIAGNDPSQHENVAYGYNTFFSNPYKIRRIQILRNTNLNQFKNYLRSFKKKITVDSKVINDFNLEIEELKEKYLK